MQHFSTADLEGLEGYMKDEIANDISDGKVTDLHLHSYNASQHFKSSGAIEYFTSHINYCGGATDCMYVYSFGAPGHGKGFFDSLGGTLKKTQLNQRFKNWERHNSWYQIWIYFECGVCA